jgi:hypothetical protein
MGRQMRASLYLSAHSGLGFLHFETGALRPRQRSVGPIGPGRLVALAMTGMVRLLSPASLGRQCHPAQPTALAAGRSLKEAMLVRGKNKTLARASKNICLATRLAVYQRDGDPR